MAFNLFNLNDCFQDLNVGLPEDILRRKLHGDFGGAIRLIELRLTDKNTPEALRKSLTAQREIIRRLPSGFPYSRDEALACVREHIPDFTESEFDRYVDDRLIRWIYINGQERYIKNFYGTLYKTDAAFAKRADGAANLKGSESVSGVAKRSPLDYCIEKLKSEGSMSCRIEIAASVTLSREKIREKLAELDNNSNNGESRKIIVHIPIPAQCEQQSEIKILEYTNNINIPGIEINVKIAPEDASQRTITWEVETKNPDAGVSRDLAQDLIFRVRYSYLHTACYHDTWRGDARGQHCTFDKPDKLVHYLREEQPHITFTPYIHSLVQELTGDISAHDNRDLALEKARRFYDFITLNMHYTFMPGYFVLDNIPENCALSFTGDCGVLALLFITLCRCAGIPAAWQSGLTAEPGYCGSHDWARFYTPSFGWLFADASYGTSATRANNEERRKFYFGNLDPWRMVANREFCVPFDTTEHAWRADPYDNQVGEIEFYSVNNDGTVKALGLRHDEFEVSREILQHEELLAIKA